MSKYGDISYGDQRYRRYVVRGYYILYPINNGVVDYTKWTYEHRVAYEFYNNVKLTKDMVVHHINHDKMDNSKDNLAVYTNSEHTRMHKIEECRQDGKHVYCTEQHVCIDCGVPLSDFRSNRCVKCAHMQQRKPNHPTRDELSEYIKTMSNTEIARMCNVSDSAVRKWRKKYNLPSANEQHGWLRGVKKKR